jgi:uncharacterized membrane protein
MFSAVGIFLIVVTAIYWTLSGDWTGTSALTLTIGLCGLVAFYLWFTARRVGWQPEDDINAEVGDGAGDVGFYSPHSWWPLPVAGSAAVLSLGLIFGWWLVYIGLIMLLLSTVGFVFEYYRGDSLSSEH